MRQRVSVLPAVKINLDVVYLKPVRKRSGHLHVYAVILLAVSERYDKRPLGKVILPDPSVEDQLVCGHLHTLRARRDLVKKKYRVLSVTLLIGKYLRCEPLCLRLVFVREDQPADLDFRHLRQADVDDLISVLIAYLLYHLRLPDTGCPEPENGMLDVVRDIEFYAVTEFLYCHDLTPLQSCYPAHVSEIFARLIRQHHDGLTFKFPRPYRIRRIKASVGQYHHHPRIDLILIEKIIHRVHIRPAGITRCAFRNILI